MSNGINNGVEAVPEAPVAAENQVAEDSHPPHDDENPSSNSAGNFDVEEPLHPHLFLERRLPGTSYDLFVQMKMDSAEQSVNVLRLGPPRRGEKERKLVMVVRDNAGAAAYGKKEYYKIINIANRQPGEEMVTVIVRHLDGPMPHGGSGSIHYPPGGDGD